MSGPEASGRRPAKKAPAAKKVSADSKPTTAKKTAPAAKKVSPSKSATASGGGPPRKQAAAKSTDLASSGRSPARKVAPKKASTACRAKAPSEREVVESRSFKKAKTRAERVLSDPEKMRGLAAEAANKSDGARSGPISKILDEISALVRLVVAYARGTYRDVPVQTMLLILAGLIYFVSPVDLIPDVVPVIGLTDDAVVLGFVIRTVRQELDAFMNWETGQGKGE